MVYVDNMHQHKIGNYRGMKMSHMIADTTEELLDMATKIGVDHKWIQYQGTAREHFDICLSKRKKAVSLGAKEITWKEAGRIILSK